MQIPQWMFDVAALCAVRTGVVPVVNSEAWIEISLLLSAVLKQRAEDVLKARHPSLNDTGDSEVQILEGSTQGEMKLFQPIPVRLRWSQLPPEIRQRTLRLLARLLREHIATDRERGGFTKSDPE
jgi:hypothetical protein